MPVTQLPFANGFYESSSLPLSAQECVNRYPHTPDEPALNSAVLFDTPGLYQVASSGLSITNANRGGHRMEGKPYYVNGGNLFRLNEDNSLDNLGMISGTGRVSMDDNGTQLMILVPGGSGYIFTEGPDTLTQITDTDFTANGNPLYVKFIDGYFCVTTDGKKFVISALNNGLSWDALDSGAAESSPDGVVVPIVFKNQLFIGGERTTEAFQNIGGAEFPFQRTGLFLDKGVTAPFSVILTSGTFMFLGAGENERPAIWALEGNGTTKISTQAIDAELQKLSQEELTKIYSWSYAQLGHYFVGFVFPDSTFVFDVTTGKWHERKSRIRNNNETFSTATYRAASIISAYGIIYASDSRDGRIGVLDLDTYTEYGENIVRSSSTQPFQNNMLPFFAPKIEMTVESGQGLVPAPPYNCQAVAEYVNSNPNLFSYYVFADNKTNAQLYTYDESGNARPVTFLEDLSPSWSFAALDNAPAGCPDGLTSVFDSDEYAALWPLRALPAANTPYTGDTVTVGGVIRVMSVDEQGAREGQILLRVGYYDDNTSQYGWCAWIDSDGDVMWRDSDETFTDTGIDYDFGDWIFCELTVNIQTGAARLNFNGTIVTTTFSAHLGINPTLGMSGSMFWPNDSTEDYHGTAYYRQMWVFDGPSTDLGYPEFIRSFPNYEPPVVATDPKIRLQISRDGGYTFADERARSMGKIGEYRRRAVWRRNGHNKQTDIYRFITSDPVKGALLQLTAQIEGEDAA